MLFVFQLHYTAPAPETATVLRTKNSGSLAQGYVAEKKGG